MSYDDLLSHLATYKAPAPATDRFGQPTGVLEAKASDVPCRLSRPSGGEVLTEATRDAVENNFMLYLGPDATLVEGDVVTQVKDKLGNVLAQNLDVLIVRPVSGLDGVTHHKEARCFVAR